MYLADWRMDLCLFDASIYLSVQGAVATTGSSHLGRPPRVRAPECTPCFAAGVRRMGPGYNLCVVRGCFWACGSTLLHASRMANDCGMFATVSFSGDLVVLPALLHGPWHLHSPTLKLCLAPFLWHLLAPPWATCGVVLFGAIRSLSDV